MFTGIIEAIGTVKAARPVAGGSRLQIEAGLAAEGAQLGASIAINGVCLTVSSIDGTLLSFDVITETLSRSNLGILRTGSRVNLERSMRADGRIDGHFVQGHIDGSARIRERVENPAESLMGFAPDPSLLPYLIPKGSVAIDGVSLTIAEVRDDGFSVAFIPTTLRDTALWDKPVGDVVNIETDVIARTVVHWLNQAGGGNPGFPSLQKLQELGFA
jgi:riboflavin synthase